MRRLEVVARATSPSAGVDVADEVTRVEKEYLVQILDECNGRIGVAADRAGLNRKSFYSKMKQYGLRKEDFKE